jgi:hypothetical protein
MPYMTTTPASSRNTRRSGTRDEAIFHSGSAISGELWELGNDDLHLVVESIHVNPAQALCRIFGDAGSRSMPTA